MKRSTKVLVSIIGCLVIVPVVAVLLLGFVWFREEKGTGPSKPLKRTSEEIVLSNGGRVRVEGLEEEGFRKNIFLCSASYLPPMSREWEGISNWRGRWDGSNIPSVFVVGQLIVLPTPDRHALWVRSSKGFWRPFVMVFPSPERSNPNLPLGWYCQMTSLKEDEITRINKTVEDDEKLFVPSVQIKNFDPTTRTLTVLYRRNLVTGWQLVLELSEDGEGLHLLSIEKEKSR